MSQLFTSGGQNIGAPGSASFLEGAFLCMWSGRSPDFEDEKYVVWQVCPSSSFFWPALVLVVENPPANAEDVRDVSSIPGLGRSPGGWHGNPLQYSCLENPLDGDWWTTFCVCVCAYSVASVMSNCLQLYGLKPVMLLCPWDSLSKNTGAGCHALF